MHPQIMNRFRQIVADRKPDAASALEVGGILGPKSLLRIPELERAECHVINLSLSGNPPGIHTHQGNSNDMQMFAAESFDLVLSNAVLEHDLHFWKSIAEMQRVLKPGGLMVIGVPGFTPLPDDTGQATQTFKYHHSIDYYRFSEDAVTDFFFEGMEQVKTEIFLLPPRVIASGVKP